MGQFELKSKEGRRAEGSPQIPTSQGSFGPPEIGLTLPPLPSIWAWTQLGDVLLVHGIHLEIARERALHQKV